MSNISILVKTLIQKYHVLVFSKSYCPFCKQVKELFTKLKIDFHVEELDTANNGSEIQDELFNLTKQRTVPNVFINGKHIGGSEAVNELYKNNELLSLIQGKDKSIN